MPTARTQRPTVSVVINTLNRRDHLEQTLTALQRQTYPQFEVIVVNGPSIDGTDEMLKQWTNRIRLENCAEACLGRSRNIGLAAAAGEIVAFIDDDAIAEPDWLEQIVAPYANPRVGAVGGPVFDVPLGRIDWKLCVCTRLGEPITDAPGPIEQYLGAGADPFAYLAGCNMSFRRSVLELIGGFSALLAYGYDDVDVCCRLIDAGFDIAYVEQALVRHERAPSAVRDEHQMLRDPYPITHSRAVFSLHNGQGAHSVEEIVTTMLDSVQHWRNVADQHLAAGQLTADEHGAFIDRALSGAEQGITAGTAARPVDRIAAAPAHLFHRYD